MLSEADCLHWAALRCIYFWHLIYWRALPCQMSVSVLSTLGFYNGTFVWLCLGPWGLGRCRVVHWTCGCKWGCWLIPLVHSFFWYPHSPSFQASVLSCPWDVWDIFIMHVWLMSLLSQELCGIYPWSALSCWTALDTVPGDLLCALLAVLVSRYPWTFQWHSV